MGRPPKLVLDDATLDQLTKLGEMQCTYAECARFFRVSMWTFKEFMKKEEAADAFARGKAVGLISLRRIQFALAKTHAGMAIFLGKNYLGQSDAGASPDSDTPQTGPTITVVGGLQTKIGKPQ